MKRLARGARVRGRGGGREGGDSGTGRRRSSAVSLPRPVLLAHDSTLPLESFSVPHKKTNQSNHIASS